MDGKPSGRRDGDASPEQHAPRSALLGPRGASRFEVQHPDQPGGDVARVEQAALLVERERLGDPAAEAQVVAELLGLREVDHGDAAVHGDFHALGIGPDVRARAGDEEQAELLRIGEVAHRAGRPSMRLRKLLGVAADDGQCPDPARAWPRACRLRPLTSWTSPVCSAAHGHEVARQRHPAGPGVDVGLPERPRRSRDRCAHELVVDVLRERKRRPPSKASPVTPRGPGSLRTSKLRRAMSQSSGVNSWPTTKAVAVRRRSPWARRRGATGGDGSPPAVGDTRSSRRWWRRWRRPGRRATPGRWDRGSAVSFTTVSRACPRRRAVDQRQREVGLALARREIDGRQSRPAVRRRRCRRG